MAKIATCLRSGPKGWELDHYFFLLMLTYIFDVFNISFAESRKKKIYLWWCHTNTHGTNLRSSPRMICIFVQRHLAVSFSYPKCWHDISNTSIYIQWIYVSPNIYSTNIYFSKYIFPHPATEGRTEALQLTFIPQVLAWHIQYQAIYSSDLYFPNCL